MNALINLMVVIIPKCVWKSLLLSFLHLCFSYIKHALWQKMVEPLEKLLQRMFGLYFSLKYRST